MVPRSELNDVIIDKSPDALSKFLISFKTGNKNIK